MEDPYDVDAMLGRAEDAVRRLMAQGADMGEAFVAAGTGVSVQVEKDVVTYTTGDSEGGTGVRVVKDGRLGFAYTSDPSRLDEAGAKALELMAEFGDSELIRVKELAALKAMIDRLVATAISDTPDKILAAQDNYVRLTNIALKKEAELRERRAVRERAKAPTLAEWLKGALRPSLAMLRASPWTSSL